jgi:hypothetical protein
MMHRDGRVDQIAPKGPKPCEDAIFVCASKPGVADDVSDQDRSEFPGLGHGIGAVAPGSPVGGFGMAAFPCCTDETRRPGMQARRSVA